MRKLRKCNLWLISLKYFKKPTREKRWRFARFKTVRGGLLYRGAPANFPFALESISHYHNSHFYSLAQVWMTIHSAGFTGQQVYCTILCHFWTKLFIRGVHPKTRMFYLPSKVVKRMFVVKISCQGAPKLWEEQNPVSELCALSGILV